MGRGWSATDCWITKTKSLFNFRNNYFATNNNPATSNDRYFNEIYWSNCKQCGIATHTDFRGKTLLIPFMKSGLFSTIIRLLKLSLLIGFYSILSFTVKID